MVILSLAFVRAFVPLLPRRPATRCPSFAVPLPTLLLVFIPVFIPIPAVAAAVSSIAITISIAPVPVPVPVPIPISLPSSATVVAVAVVVAGSTPRTGTPASAPVPLPVSAAASGAAAFPPPLALSELSVLLFFNFKRLQISAEQFLPVPRLHRNVSLIIFDFLLDLRPTRCGSDLGGVREELQEVFSLLLRFLA
eukprot:Rmarinus@m.23933